jgi:hypothetical protein
VWKVQLSSDYVGGLQLLPGGAHVLAAAADGALSVLEWRRNGDVAAQVSVGAPLRCVDSDGALAIAGSEGGLLAVWDVAQALGQLRTAALGTAAVAPGPEGLYAPLRCESKAPVNSVHVSGGWGLAGQEDGCLALFAM